jgi:hypothetical protein
MWENDNSRNELCGFYFHSINRIRSGTIENERWIRENELSGNDRWRFHCMWKRKICTKFVPHSLMDEQKERRHIMPRLHSDLWGQSQFSSLYCNWGWVMAISVWPRDETSEHAVGLKVVTRAQKVSFAKVQDQNHADHIFWQTVWFI